MNHALALLEFSHAPAGILAVDAMLKRAPVALLRCGTVHPGRYLALVGGSVASTQEAHFAGIEVGVANAALLDEVFLPDPTESLVDAVMGTRIASEAEAIGVIDVAGAPGLLRGLDAALKSVPVRLLEARLADDLGGRAIALFDGLLPDVQEALDLLEERAAPARIFGRTVLPRVDETLRDVLAGGTIFASCKNWTPLGAEILTPEG